MYKAILLPVDLGHLATQRKAAAVAGELARNADARLHVMTVVPDFGMSIVGNYFPKDFEKDALAAAGRQLRAFADKELGVDRPVQHTVARGSIYHEIIDTAGKLGCDLIVMASHRPEFADYLIGPNAARVVRHAPQSVLVVRG